MNNKKYSQNAQIIKQLSEIDKALAQQEIVPEQLDDHAYQDSTVPAMKNLFAYNQFIKNNATSGIHVDIDANSFDELNNTHGIEHGNQSIKELFELISILAEKYGLKTFRTYGDQVSVWSKDQEVAEKFAEELKQHLEGNKSNLSVCIGLGFTSDQAKEALAKAKSQIGNITDGVKIKKFKLGDEPTVISSLLSDSPPPTWRPAVEDPLPQAEGILPSGVKIENPL